MRRPAALLLVAIVAVLLVGWTLAKAVAGRRDPKVQTFLQEADALISALQNYREFVGSFPGGSQVDIGLALSGQGSSDRKVLVIANSLKNRNSQGEMTDPWGKPLQIYFSKTSVVIRSAGPNGTFEDSANPNTDDLYRSDAR